MRLAGSIQIDMREMEVLFKVFHEPPVAATIREHKSTVQAHVQPGSQDPGLPDAGPEQGPSRVATILAFMVTDAAALVTVAFLLRLIGKLAPSTGVLPDATTFLSAIAILIAAYAASGLYVGSTMHPAEEMRRVMLTTVIALGAIGTALLVHEGASVQTTAFFGFVVCVTATWVAIFRLLSRILFARREWWGYPIVVISDGCTGANVVKTLKRWPELGLKPVALLSDELPEGIELEGVPVYGVMSDAPALALEHNFPCAVLAPSNVPPRELAEMVGYFTKFYRRLLIIPDVVDMSALWTGSWFFGGVVGYGVQHRRCKPLSQFIRRLIDITFAGLGILLLIPIWLLIALLVKIDSTGPVFYRQTRIGRGGRIFKVIKFRSMHVDASHRLQEILNDSGLRQEYEVYRKLREDPRVTSVGKFLRRYSLDELPQLLNILRGDMSIVGPRAYTPNEVAAMQNMEGIISQNAPGLTGLWQVSGRNNLSFEERINIDVQYTKNASFWLDAFIVLRTIPTVLSGEGAC